ncbi:MAG TPA: biotin/lipoyl-containing protein [Ktedonobacteraceae bacterium]|nr:biotin/lipoyl-containing protein [Ktedonobacteraceae bacterium]
MDTQKQSSWLERIEDLIHVLEGSTIGELELSEAGTEIIIRRSPGMVLVSSSRQGNTGPLQMQAGNGEREQRNAQGVAIIAPLTGVYYSAASPTTPPFVAIGDIVQVGQVVALIEAMKVFNEIQAEVAGRVLALVGKNGQVVQKGDVLLRIEPV